MAADEVRDAQPVGGVDGLDVEGTCRQGPRGRFQKAAPGRSEVDPALAAGEQPDAQPGLEASDPLGQRLLRQEQLFRRPAEVQPFGGSDDGGAKPPSTLHGRRRTRRQAP